jgi:GAF domain-containing protein
MGDDAATVEQLRAELHQARQEIQTVRQRDAALVGQLAESREQQFATAEVLRVIASSPTDLGSVLQAIIDTAARLCDAAGEAMERLRARDGRLVACAITGYTVTNILRDCGPDFFERMPGFELDHQSIEGRAFLDGRTVAVDDMAEAVLTAYPRNRERTERAGHRSTVTVPLMQGGTAIGVLWMVRRELRPFSETEISLLETFADQDRPDERPAGPRQRQSRPERATGDHVVPAGMADLPISGRHRTPPGTPSAAFRRRARRRSRPPRVRRRGERRRAAP